MSTTQGHIELARAIDSIRVGARHRTDYGDIDALAASIREQGLLQPITVTPDGDLVCGARRLAALRQLGMRTVSVWVRSGISDELAKLLAEKDENALHKPLSPTESAVLYREVKTLLAEEAKRRQEASRFPRVKNGGAASDAAPQQRGAGDSRSQAALFVTGRRSYDTLERIGHLQRIVDDEDATDELRASAETALAAIDGGARVKPTLRALNAQFSAEPGAPHLLTVDEGTIDDLRVVAAQAFERAKTASESKRSKSIDTSDGSAGHLPTKAFVFQWADLYEWWLRYDVEDIAVDLSAEQWEHFEATIAGSVAFTDAVRRLRELRIQPSEAVG